MAVYSVLPEHTLKSESHVLYTYYYFNYFNFETPCNLTSSHITGRTLEVGLNRDFSHPQCGICASRADKGGKHAY